MTVNIAWFKRVKDKNDEKWTKHWPSSCFD